MIGYNLAQSIQTVESTAYRYVRLFLIHFKLMLFPRQKFRDHARNLHPIMISADTSVDAKVM